MLGSVGTANNSEIRSKLTAACWNLSKICESCWTGPKKKVRYRLKATSAPWLVVPSATRAVPKNRTVAWASSVMKEMPGKKMLTAACARVRSPTYRCDCSPMRSESTGPKP